MSNNDVQIYELDASLDTNFATDHIEKHYSDILDYIKVLQFDNFTDKKECAAVLNREGMTGELEYVFEDSAAFWNYDGRGYFSKYIPNE